MKVRFIVSRWYNQEQEDWLKENLTEDEYTCTRKFGAHGTYYVMCMEEEDAVALRLKFGLYDKMV